MRKILSALALTIVLAACCSYPEVESSMPYKVEGGTIVTKVPDRQPGQSSSLGLRCEPLDTVRVGFVGLGMRGESAVGRYLFIDGVKITAICDKDASRVKRVSGILSEEGRPAAKEFIGEDAWKDLCESDDVDLVYICTPWLLHTPIAVYAMEHGKHVATEVPAATSLAECWELVNTCERTRRHCMMLENCVYDYYEMTALNMAQKGLFGEILHAEGAYIHNLDPFWDEYSDNWRLDYNYRHRGDNYPTHGIGPVCQALNIHRGDKLDYLVSMDTKAVHGLEKAKEKMGVDSFEDGDHTVTLIRTEKGKQIEIQHNVYGSRPYSRMYQLSGDKGYAGKYPEPTFSLRSELLPDEEIYHNLDGESPVSQDVMNALLEDYKHPITAEYEEKAKEVGGHGGMDFIMDSRLIYCLRNGLPLDEDVYDAAEWSCLTELSGLSIKSGSMPVRVPDFTRGEWNRIQGLTFAE